MKPDLRPEGVYLTRVPYPSGVTVTPPLVVITRVNGDQSTTELSITDDEARHLLRLLAVEFGR